MAGLTTRLRAGEDPGLVTYDGGLKLAGTSLWLDARRAVPLSFVSSARAFLRHQRVVTSPGTAELVAGELGSSEALGAPYGRPFSLGELGLELVPAGHVVGSAGLLVRFRGLKLLYLAGVRPGPSLVAEPFEPRRADVLVLDCPYDAAPYRFPGRDSTLGALLGWVREVLADGRPALVLASALGTAQELGRALAAGAGLPVRVHRAVARWNRLARRAGRDPGRAPELRKPVDAPVAVLAPVGAARSPGLDRLVPGARRALASGRALLDSELEAAGAERAFALSSHADGRALRRLVDASGARFVYLGPRHTDRFEASLRRAGLGVRRFAGPAVRDQLPLF